MATSQFLTEDIICIGKKKMNNEISYKATLSHYEKTMHGTDAYKAKSNTVVPHENSINKYVVK